MLLLAVFVIAIGALCAWWGFKAYHKKTDSYAETGAGRITTGSVIMCLGAILVVVHIIITTVVIYEEYPAMEALYDTNASIYRQVVDTQNEVATEDLDESVPDGATMLFDGSDFGQSKATSDRYAEYRDAIVDYNRKFVVYRKQGGSFMFWPLPDPPERLKKIALR